MTHDWHLVGMLAFALGTVSQGAVAQGGATSDTSGFVRSDDGTRLYYHQLGSGAPVIIVPAGLFLERDFAALAHGHRVVFYDMRDRGRSDSVGDSTRVAIALDVADLEAVRRHLGAERFVAIGWSYLGQVVMRYAAAHPERLERIVLIGPLARQIGTAYPDSLRALDAEPVPAPSQAAALARARTEGLPMRDPRGDCEMDYQVNRVRLVGDPRLAPLVPDVCAMPNEWWIHLQRHNNWLFGTIIRDEPPGWDRFAGLTVPVLLIHGTQDRNVPYGAGREWAAHLPDARLLTVPGAAHMPWIDAPGIVIPAIDGFVRGAWPAHAIPGPSAR
jgi:pimeloyl-ACP methyl ester carboxylesterase